MGLTYFKRYRMEIDLSGRRLSEPKLAPPYSWVPWDLSMLEVHAETKYFSFRTEIDANVFPCLGELSGCHRLMTDISRKDGFLGEATWLIAYYDADNNSQDYCGTIQGVRDRKGIGAIQNVGITPEHRGCGLGSALLVKALIGFRRAGLARAFLEVTAQNDGAIRLYQRMGFSKVRTVYKAVEVAYS